MDNPAAFVPHILSKNRQALEALITKPEVERKLLLRLRKKAAIYAQDFAPDGEIRKDSNGNVDTRKIDVDGVVDLYESYIIPLTKEIEVSRTSNFLISISLISTRKVDYLIHRLDGMSQEEIDKLGNTSA